MNTALMNCPNPKCGKQLRVPVDPDQPDRKCRCKACLTTFALSVSSGKNAEPDEEEDGAYGIAAETSLPYLLRREQDGFKLTRDEKIAKKRLITERLRANPRGCPGCEARLPRGGVLCVRCGFDLRTGRRLTTKVVVQSEAAAAGAGAVIEEGTAGAALELIVTILECA